MRFWHYLAIATLTFTMAGCAGTRNTTKSGSVESLYHQGKRVLAAGNYSKAIDYFQTLEGRYPFGLPAQQAQLEIAYAYYKNGEPQSTISAVQEFIKQNPTSPKVAYAYYLMGLANFPHQGRLMTLLRPAQAYQTDITPLKLSFVAFKTLIKKFPHSPYAPDARRRLIYLRNWLAAHEIYVAKYYQERGEWVAVINRCKVILVNYPQAPQVFPALRMMITAYRHLGLTKLAQQTREVLKYNQRQNKSNP